MSLPVILFFFFGWRERWLWVRVEWMSQCVREIRAKLGEILLSISSQKKRELTPQMIENYLFYLFIISWRDFAIWLWRALGWVSYSFITKYLLFIFLLRELSVAQSNHSALCDAAVPRLQIFFIVYMELQFFEPLRSLTICRTSLCVNQRS